MNLKNFNESQFLEAYGIQCAQINTEHHNNGIYPTFCKIQTGQKTLGHAHFEPEVFYIIEGKGEVRINGRTFPLKKGDLFHVEAFTQHEIINTGENEFHCLSVYSEDMQIPSIPKEILLTTAPPTPNGPLHLGHMSGPYLGSDILRRYFESKSSKVKSISGTDDHQNYVEAKAKSLGKSVEFFSKEMRARIQEGLKNFNIIYDEFMNPSQDQEYLNQFESFYQEVQFKKIIKKETVLFPYCESCQDFLVDAHIEGSCPVCHESSRGGCESCGIVVMPNELKSPHCSTCKTPASLKEAEIETFNLTQNLSLIEDSLKTLDLSEKLEKLIKQIRTHEQRVLITYPAREKTIKHVWFEMASSYERFANSQDFWIHSFGFDNSFYYLLFIPAILKAKNVKLKFPDRVMINEFLNLEGSKFSTSRNHAIWADEVGTDANALRMFLSLNRPSTSETNFEMSEFETFQHRLNSKFDQLREKLKKEDERPLKNQARRLTERFKKSMDYEFHLNQLNINRAARLCLDFLETTLEQKGQKDTLHMAQELKIWLNIFMPGTHL